MKKNELYFYVDGLESERLVTRFLTPDDASAWTPFFEDPATDRFLINPNRLKGHARSTAWMERQLERYRTRTYGLQALLLKETGEWIGQCGLLLQSITGHTELEVGYHLFASQRGKGYATEAARLFRDFGFMHRQAESIVSMIHVENAASQRVARQNGMQRDTRFTYGGEDFFVYRIGYDAWEKRSL